MASDDLFKKLTAFLAEDLEQAAAARLAARLVASERALTVMGLLAELREGSRKAAAAVVQALPAVLQALDDAECVAWIDLAVSMSERSGAAVVKFCRESPGLLERLAPSACGPVLEMALELAEQDPNLALEGLRQAAGVVTAAGARALAAWARVGADLAKLDYVLGIEYFRRGPEILRVLPVDDLKTWAALSVKLVAPNSMGKPDYMAPLAFFRTSPVLLEDLATPAVRRRVLTLGSLLADRSPEQAIGFLGEAPGWLRRIKDPGWQERVLQYGVLVAEQDSASALAYLRRAPELIELAGSDSPSWGQRFEEWYRGGMEVLSYNPEAARAYFAVETRKALEAIERAMSGVALRSVARLLKLFAEGLSGHPVTIRALDETGRGERGTICLPARMGACPTREENLRLYKVLTAHEAGHLEYGTYDLDTGRLNDIAAQACLRYGRRLASPPASLAELFRLYPHPLLIRDLWMLAEDARIEACLKAEYPGLRRDMETVAREEVRKRSLLHGMSAREMVVELLLRLSTGDPEQVRIPFALEDVVTRAWALIQAVAQPHATAEAVVRAVHRAYVLIEELTASEAPASSSEGASPESRQGPGPPAGENQGGTYRPMMNLTHRGVMDAERIRRAERQADEKGREEFHGGPLETAHLGEPAHSPGTGSTRDSSSLRRSVPAAAQAPSGIGPLPLVEEVLTLPEEEEGPALSDPRGGREFLYDEWDGTIQDYRHHWCRVVERNAPEGSEAFIEQIRSAYGGVVSLIRRYFEGIRPPALRRMRRQADGEEVDIEAAVERLVERRARVTPSEFVHIRRDRRDRDVAAAFLIDLSGSTGQQIGSGGTRIIDVEKEGLVLLCEALEAIGDQYAIYGYSGQSRRDVQVLILKDFDERYGPQVWRRIDATQPMIQNRDGAAIRHALRRLSACAARVKLMILLSDGRPLDDAYQDEYALEDTKAALREAKAQGVHPFCITVDAEAPGYLARMYGDVCYLIIDRVQSLPERLPRIYRTLTT
jgi:nitric oxide reductase activation protein